MADINDANVGRSGIRELGGGLNGLKKNLFDMVSLYQQHIYACSVPRVFFYVGKKSQRLRSVMSSQPSQAGIPVFISACVDGVRIPNIHPSPTQCRYTYRVRGRCGW